MFHLENGAFLSNFQYPNIYEKYYILWNETKIQQDGLKYTVFDHISIIFLILGPPEWKTTLSIFLSNKFTPSSNVPFCIKISREKNKEGSIQMVEIRTKLQESK